jgi:hypothetical protein
VDYKGKIFKNILVLKKTKPKKERLKKKEKINNRKGKVEKKIFYEKKNWVRKKPENFFLKKKSVLLQLMAYRKDENIKKSNHNFINRN